MEIGFDPSWLSRYPTQNLEDTGSPCSFCAIINGETDSQILAETSDTICFLDHLPATYGHALVVPKQHYRDLFDISAESFSAVTAMAKRVANALRASCLASGVNLVHASGAAAHQTVFHFHVHVVPRYDGDSIVVFPRLADPVRKDEVADRLRAALGEPNLPERLKP